MTRLAEIHAAVLSAAQQSSIDDYRCAREQVRRVRARIARLTRWPDVHGEREEAERAYAAACRTRDVACAAVNDIAALIAALPELFPAGSIPTQPTFKK